MLYRDPQRARREIPVLRMLDADEPTLEARARRLADGIGEAATRIRVRGKVGGGALPLLELDGPAIALQTARDPVAVARALREADPPVVPRIHDGRVLLDPRTIADGETAAVVQAVRAVLDA
jgi:L-seryl-tRNA(Ser) seleniumtransferase